MTFNRRFFRFLGAATVIIIADYLLVLIDCIIAGRVLGEVALGAMNLLMPVFSFATFCCWLLASGTSRVYSLAISKGDDRRAAALAGQGVVASVALGVALVAALMLLETPYLDFMGPSDEVTAFSALYWDWYPLVVVLQSVELMVIYLAFVRGGELVCIASFAVQVVANVVASYALALLAGMHGIVLGSVIAQIAGLLVLVPWAFSSRVGLRLRLGFDPVVLARSVRTSFAESSVWLVHAALFFAITKYVLSAWDSESLPVCAVVFCIIRLTTFFGGVSVALGPLESAQRRGTDVSRELAGVFRIGSATALALMALAAAVFFVAPELLIGIFGIESSDLVTGSKLAARITVGGLLLCGAAGFLPLLHRVRRSKLPEAPLNYLQDYVLERIAVAPEAMMFNLAKLFRLRRGIDLERLSAALVASGVSHVALRTVLRRDADGAAFQRQELPAGGVRCPVVSADEAELLANKASLVQSFTVFGSPLFEAKIFDCGERAYLLSNFHHLICDGYSFPLILNDAHRAWNGEQLASDAYYEVLARREERANAPVVVAGRNLFRELIRSGTFTTLPTPDVDGPRGYGSMELPIVLPAGFDDFLAARRATRHHVFLAAALRALACHTAANALLIDWVFHGRVTKDELRTVGAFMVDLPLVVDDISEMTASDLLSHVKQGTFRGIKNANTFRNVSDLNPTGQDRLTFIYQDEWGELMSPGPVREDGPFAWMIEETIPLTAQTAATENPFNVEIMEHRDATRLFLEFDTGRYSPAAARRYADLFIESFNWLTAQ